MLAAALELGRPNAMVVPLAAAGAAAELAGAAPNAKLGVLAAGAAEALLPSAAAGADAVGTAEPPKEKAGAEAAADEGAEAAAGSAVAGAAPKENAGAAEVCVVAAVNAGPANENAGALLAPLPATLAVCWAAPSAAAPTAFPSLGFAGSGAVAGAGTELDRSSFLLLRASATAAAIPPAGKAVLSAGACVPAGKARAAAAAGSAQEAGQGPDGPVRLGAVH